MIAMSIIPPTWREHANDIVFISTFFGAITVIAALMWKVFGKRVVRWADRRFDAAIERVVNQVIIPIMETNDRYYQARILQLEDRLEEVEARPGG